MSTTSDRTDRLSDAPTTSSGLSVGALAVLTAVVVAAVVTVLLWWPLHWIAIVVGIIIGAAAAWLLVSRSTTAILSLTGGRPSDPQRDARLLNVLEGLALAGGVQAPDLRVVEDDTVNAMVVGVADRDATLVVTQGSIDRLDRIQFEGLVAHALCRLREADQAARGVAVTTIRLPRYLADRFGSATGRGRHDPSTEALVATDADAVALTRYPPGLLGAIEVASSAGTAVSAGRPSISHLWFAPVDGDDAGLIVRADALREL